jgi:membrane protein YdbS with pleckstrin-like domain
VPADGIYCHRCGRKIDEAAPALTEAAQVATLESDLWKGVYSGRAMIPSGVALGLLSLLSLVLCLVATVSWHWGWAPWGLWLAAMLALWIYYGIVSLHRRWGIHYRLTSQRFFYELGMFLRSTDCIYLADVDAIQVVQSLPQRLLGVGTITILTHDISRPKLILRGVADIDRIFTLLEQARREAALHPPIANPSYETAANQNRPGSVVTSDQHPATLER